MGWLTAEPHEDNNHLKMTGIIVANDIGVGVGQPAAADLVLTGGGPPETGPLQPPRHGVVDGRHDVEPTSGSASPYEEQRITDRNNRPWVETQRPIPEVQRHAVDASRRPLDDVVKRLPEFHPAPRSAVPNS